MVLSSISRNAKDTPKTQTLKFFETAFSILYEFKLFLSPKKSVIEYLVLQNLNLGFIGVKSQITCTDMVKQFSTAISIIYH